MYQLYRDQPFLVLGMVLANIALSIWCITLDPVINNDGITYLAIAQMMLDGQWTDAFDYFSWPYYSVFIAGVAKVFFMDVETAAHVLNTFFVTSLTLAFICIVAELSDNNRRVILIAALVILFFPSITKYRSFIIRDFGYLSCYLWSLYFIFRFCSTLNKSHLAGWLLFAALSCLFRFEGIAFLLIAPYFLLLFTARDMAHRGKILTLMSFIIVALSVSLLIWYVNDKYAAMIETAQASGKNIHTVFDLFLANTQSHLGGEDLTLFNYIGMFTANIGNVAYELVRRMAVFYFLFAIYAYWKNAGLKRELIKRIWIVYVVINFLVLACFSVYNNFLVSRYTMATALTLLLLAPFVIDQLLRAFRETNLTKRILSVIALSMLSIASAEGLDVRTKKKHIKEAGLWIKNELPEGTVCFSNERLLMYYAEPDLKTNLKHRYDNDQLRILMDSRKIRDYEYVAISVNPRNKLEDIYRQTLSYHFGRPDFIFDGVDGRAVYLFKTE